MPKLLIKSLLVFISVFFIFVLCVVFSLSLTVPFAIQKIASNNFQIDISIEKSEISLPRGIINFDNIQVTDTLSQKRGYIKKINIDFSPEKLFSQTLSINNLVINSLNLDIEKTRDNIKVLGINPERFKTPEKESKTQEKEIPEDSTPPKWNIAAKSIELSNWKIKYKETLEDSNSETLTLLLEKFLLNNIDTSSQKSKTEIDIALESDGIKLKTNGWGRFFDENPSGNQTIFLNDINLQKIDQMQKQLVISLPEPFNLEQILADIDYTSDIAWNLETGKEAITVNKAITIIKNLNYIISDTPEEKNQIAGDITILTEKVSLNPENNAIAISQIKTEDSHFEFSMLNPNNENVISNYEFKDFSLAIDQLVFPENKSNENAVSSITLDTLVGDFGKINIKSQLIPSDPQKNTTFSMSGEQINLTELSPITAKALNRKIQKGALDFNSEGSVSNGIIDTKLSLQAHQLAFKLSDNTKKNEEPTEFEKELGMPLNLAMNLLRNKNDTIDLSIPINGPVDDPNINIGGVINKAILNTLKTAVITQVGPLMAISALDKVKSLGDAARLKPVFFNPNESALESEQQKNLQKLSDFLEKKDKLYINICPYATSLEGKENKLTNEQLLQLAKTRANTAKAFFIEKNIEGKRLILCAPQIDDTEAALPRVEFSL